MTKGPPEGDPLNSLLRRRLRRVSNPHDRQAFRFRLLPEVQRDPVATEENNPRRRSAHPQTSCPDTSHPRADSQLSMQLI